MLIKLIERSLVYPRPSRERGDWRPRWLQPQTVWFRSGDNTKLHGWYVPNPDARRLIVYAHGNGEHVADQANLVFRLQSNLAATVFVYDYRGYGRSRGKPTERGCVADGLAAQRWLAEREGVDPEDIVLMGRSIGGGVQVAAAAEQGARALVLEATFSRMTDAAAHNYPWLPVRLVMSNRYNSIKRIQKYDGPLFQCHGADDEVVPIQLARKLFDASQSRMKQFYEIAYARHNDTPPSAYYAALATFLDNVDEQIKSLPPR
ncbi:MAG TPA: alpha/beta fold hydrolase, partial [Lacipirellulaceae bacterium]|nr:alpha/beta fold hydrolase [Lacipirellulaceae bacterium]